MLVVGGGPAGLGAAMGAAEAGAKVVLAERYGFLGGNATASLVVTLATYYTSSGIVEKPSEHMLFPADHGLGKPVIAGTLEKLVERLVKAGGAIPPSLQTGFVVPFDPEIFKLVALEMLDAAGVAFLFHSFASDAIIDDKVQGVVFETKSGPVFVKAKVIVDCTGDGDVAAHAGAPFEIGREKDGLVQPMTLMFLMTGFKRSMFDNYVEQHPDQWSGVNGLRDLIKEATAKGDLNIPREDILFFGTTREDVVNINSTRITNVKGIDVWDLTHAEIEGRKQMAQIVAFLRKYVPGFEKAYIAQSGVNVCIRETRRIMGEYKLTSEDVLKARKFDDVIAHGAYPIDIHNPAGKGTVLERLPAGESYDIPLRCLLPLKVDNMLVAGRCISGTHEALASYRVMPISIATGQAAGVCAAIASNKNQTPRTVTASAVQEELNRQGAKLKLET